MTSAPHPVEPGDHVVLVGDDGTGVRVLQELRALDVPVTAVCAQANTRFARAASAAGVRLIVDDPEDEATLRAAGVESARACGLLASADVANLHAALQLQELAPETTVVLRLLNTAVADTVRALLGNVVVLSASELAAPAFVEAALRGSADFVLDVAGRRVAVQEVDGDDPRLRMALAGVERDGRLFPVDAARVIGIVDQPDSAWPSGPQGALDRRVYQRDADLTATAARLSRATWVILRGFAGVVDRRLVVVGALFAVVVAIGALVFDRNLGIDLLDAVYFTVTTVMTVGYGDITLIEAEPGVKLFGILIIMLGGLMIALVFALVTDAIVGARLAQALGQGPLPKRDHVVVVGAGQTGIRVIEALIKTGVACVAVERSSAGPGAAVLKRLGVPVVVGDAQSEQTLDGMRLGSARALMAMTNDDLANLRCALLARARAPNLRIVLRMFDYDLAMRVERTTGIHLSRSVAALAAPAFVAALLGRRAVAVLPIGVDVMQIVEITAQRRTDVRRLEVAGQARVLAVGTNAFPDADVPVAPGDDVLAVGTAEGLARLDRHVH
jgi:Trk K+ transport system NAD-binding subunit